VRAGAGGRGHADLPELEVLRRLLVRRAGPDELDDERREKGGDDQEDDERRGDECDAIALQPAPEEL
jgi:hypothetical protein